MRWATNRALLAVAAAAIIAVSAADAAADEGERSYLPPHAERQAESPNGEQALSQRGSPPIHKAHPGRRHRRHTARGYWYGPPNPFALPGLILFSFF